MYGPASGNTGLNRTTTARASIVISEGCVGVRCADKAGILLLKFPNDRSYHYRHLPLNALRVLLSRKQVPTSGREAFSELVFRSFKM